MFTAVELLDRKAWDPAWHGLIMHFASMASDPWVLIEQLAEEPGDDLSRHRLTLAAQILAVAGSASSRNRALMGLRDEMARALLGLARERFELRHPVPNHLLSAIGWLAATGGCIDGLNLYDHVLSLWNAPDGPFDREFASELLSAMVPIVPVEYSGIIPALFDDMFRDPGWHGSDWSMKIFASMHQSLLESAAGRRPDVIDRLLSRLVGDPDYRVRMEVTWALGALGDVATSNPHVVPMLAERLLIDENERVCSYIALALEHLGEGAGSFPTVIPALIDCILRGDRAEANAAAALGSMGKVAAEHPAVVPILTESLRDDDYVLQLRAAQALARLIPLLAEPAGLLPVFVEVALGPDTLGELRAAARDGLGALAEAGCRIDAIVDRVSEILASSDRYARWNATSVVCTLVQARPDDGRLTDPAIRLLQDADPYVRATAIQCLPNSGISGSVLQRTTPLLLVYLQSDDWQLRRDTVKALGATLAKTGPDEGLRLQILDRLLHDVSEVVRGVSAEALADSVDTRETVGLIDALTGRLLQDSEWFVRSSAAKGLAALGDLASKHNSVVEALASRLKDDDQNVRWAAADALAALWRPTPLHTSVISALLEATRDKDVSSAPWAAQDALEYIESTGIRIFLGRPDHRRHGGSALWVEIDDLAALPQPTNEGTRRFAMLAHQRQSRTGG